MPKKSNRDHRRALMRDALAASTPTNMAPILNLDAETALRGVKLPGLCPPKGC